MARPTNGTTPTDRFWRSVTKYLSGAYAKGRLVELVDLPRAIDIDTFDRMLRAVDAVLAASESLSLDMAADRERLRERLVVALGAAPSGTRWETWSFAKIAPTIDALIGEAGE